jgi:transposase
MNIKNFIGVDVSKSKLDLWLMREGKEETGQSISNSKESLEKFTETLGLKKMTPLNTVLVIDLTGGYERLAVDTLWAGGYHRIILAEGRKVKNFGSSLKHNGAKTDRVDAKTLAFYGKTFLPYLKLYEPPEPNRRTLKELYARVEDLKLLTQQEKNRLKAPALNSLVKEGIERHLKMLREEMEGLEEIMDGIIKGDRELRTIHEFLNGQKGIKGKTARALMNLLPELGKVGRQRIAAISGTAPRSNDSGTLHGYRHTGGGRPALKKALFMCVLSQIRYNEEYKRKMAEMVGRGKCKMQCLGALMRKFIVVLNGKLRDELQSSLGEGMA